MTPDQLKAIKRQTETHSTFPVEVVEELLEHIEKGNDIGAVLVFRDNGTHRPCGQTVGADGKGDYAYVFKGNVRDAENAAREFIKKLEVEYPRRIGPVMLITTDETYNGVLLKIIQANHE